MDTQSPGSNIDLGRHNTVAIGGDMVAGDKVLGNKIVGLTAEQVAALLAQVGRDFQPKPFDGRCPYVGLSAFDEQDAGLFFGRERLVQDLLARVQAARFVVIAGPSGSGKSSLVRAGLIHALRAGGPPPAIPGSERWLYGALKPGRAPLDELARAVEGLAANLQAGDDLRGKGRTDPSILARWADIALGDDSNRRAVLLVDQFEEVFTQTPSEDDRLAFLNLLTRAASVEGGRVIVLLTVRSDFISECAPYPQLNELLSRQFVQVGPMRPDELVSAIALPALRVGLRVDPDLIAQIVSDMRDEPGALPLMQFALKDLFDAQQARGGVIALTLADYLARGGLRQSLERYADGILAGLNQTELELARAVFSGLIQINPGAQPTRRTAAFDELSPAGADAQTARAVIRKLADGRLITTDERDGRDVAALAHERLIEAWPWLERLVDENREAIAIRNQIGDDAAEWLRHGRDAGYLYAGGRLDYVRDHLARTSAPLSASDRDFLGACEREEAKRLRSRYLGQAAGGAIGVAAGYGVFATLSFAFANAGQNPQLMARASLAVFLAMFPVGALLGLSIGLALYRWRLTQAPTGRRAGNPPDARAAMRRRIGAATVGAAAGAAVQVLAQLITAQATASGNVVIDPLQTAIGALLGLSIGLGIGYTHSRVHRAYLTPGLTLCAAVLAETAVLVISGSLSRPLPATIVAGLLLGLLSALGFAVTAVEER